MVICPVVEFLRLIEVNDVVDVLVVVFSEEAVGKILLEQSPRRLLPEAVNIALDAGEKLYKVHTSAAEKTKWVQLLVLRHSASHAAIVIWADAWIIFSDSAFVIFAPLILHPT